MKPYDLPDPSGHFGPYGGIFVAETLMHALAELRDAYARYKDDPEFVAEFRAAPIPKEWLQHGTSPSGATWERYAPGKSTCCAGASGGRCG